MGVIVISRWPPLSILGPSILVGLAMLLPIVYLVIRSVEASPEVWDLVFRIKTFQTFGRTVILVFTVTLTSVAIGVPIAWLTTRTDLPLRRVWAVVSVLPIVIPSFIGAFLFVSALGPKGILQNMISFLGVDRLPEIYGLPGATLTLTLISYPYVLLTVRGAIRNLDPSLEESARSLGMSAWDTVIRVSLPHLRPSIVSGSLLVALYTLSDFGAVSLMRYPTFTWVIFQQYQCVLVKN